MAFSKKENESAAVATDTVARGERAWAQGVGEEGEGEGVVLGRKRIEENRELQFHRIPEDEGTAGLEAFHGKPNIRGMQWRYMPEFPA